MPVIGSLPTPDLLTNLAQLGGARFPGANTAVPSFLKTYRGYGAIQPHQTIPGYQRFHVGQLDLTAIKAFSNVLGADQILIERKSVVYGKSVSVSVDRGGRRSI